LSASKRKGRNKTVKIAIGLLINIPEMLKSVVAKPNRDMSFSISSAAYTPLYISMFRLESSTIESSVLEILAIMIPALTRIRMVMNANFMISFLLFTIT
jgi:hypothetical protein